MKHLPEKSHASFSKGYWFVHHCDSAIIKVWLSAFTGKEKVYANGELVSEKRNITSMNTIHHFHYNHRDYEIDVHCLDMGKSEFSCTVLVDGMLESSYRTRLNADYTKFEVEVNENTTPALERAFFRIKKRGLEELNEFQLKDAVREFKKALVLREDDADTHFLIACALSILEEKERGYTHLKRALELGLKGKDRLFSEDKLAFLRIQPEFDDFKVKYLE
jgi:hypothetical protein